MIIVAGHLIVATEERDAYLVSVADVNRQARDAQGCLAFVQVADPLEPDRIVIYERWDSDEALLAFRHSDPQDPSTSERPIPQILGAEVSKYRIAAVEAP
jgi:quinol monooxygenase YgiN